MQCLPAENVIQSESTFWYFLSMSLIPGGQSLIQTERHSFQREYSRPCLIPVTIIFGVSSESGVISHTLLHVLTPVLCSAEEVSRFVSPLETDTQTIKAIITWIRTDRWIVRKGIKKRDSGKKWRFSYNVGGFFLSKGWMTGEASHC